MAGMSDVSMLHLEIDISECNFSWRSHVMVFIRTYEYISKIPVTDSST